MKKLLLPLCCMFSCLSAFSQNISILQDPVSSRIFNIEKYAEIRGTPFFVDKWVKGSVLTTRGIYENLELKFDIYDNTVFFNKNDEAFEMQDDIISFTLMHKPDQPASYSHFQKGIVGPGLSGSQYVQVLEKGNISLYRLYLKHVSEMSEVNAGIVKTFTNGTKLYAEKNKVVTLLKADRESVLSLLTDKAEQVSSFISANKISFKKEEDLVKVFRYYNAL